MIDTRMKAASSSIVEASSRSLCHLIRVLADLSATLNDVCQKPGEVTECYHRHAPAHEQVRSVNVARAHK